MRVLFVGNSHTYFNDMPALFARMCREMSGEEPELQMLAYSGRSLRWHREEYFSLRFALFIAGILLFTARHHLLKIIQHFTHTPRLHMSEYLFVNLHHRSQRTTSQTCHLLNGIASVGSGDVVTL